MVEGVYSPRLISFGIFEVDLQAGELRKAGLKLKLTGQPFQVLAILLEHPGEVVTREELQKRLWPDTFVDIDHNLNAAINKIREVLGDSAENPQFVETLPRRGYRFIGAIHQESKQPDSKNRKLWSLVAVGITCAAVAILLGINGVRMRHSRPAPLTEEDTIVLSDFDNKTGDSVFDDTLKQGLSVELEQSPFLNLLSEDKVNQTLKLMGRPAGDRLTAEVTREICQRTNSKAMVTGSIARLGGQYVIGLKAVNCVTGVVLAEAQEQAVGKEAVLKALDAAAISTRSKLGESLSSVQKYATPVEEATTPSLEALKAFSMGWKISNTQVIGEGLPFQKQAVELDPNFAVAYLAMAENYWSDEEVGRAAENARRAYDLREKVSERERLWIEAEYYFLATGEMEKAARTFELWKQTYPRDYEPLNGLGLVSWHLGNWERALQEHRESLRLAPSGPFNYFNLVWNYMALNRLDEAEAVYKQAEARNLEFEYQLLYLYRLAFLKGDAAQMAQMASAAIGKPPAEAFVLAAQADTEGFYGKLKHAHELTQKAMSSARYNDAHESAAAYQDFLTLWKDADPDIPVLIAAKAEYAKLK